ncbi:MAG: TlpA family protein disulfide reductase [Sphingobacteriales bacterium]|nr:TlpA family protein disulfide reductase [Sphingobacteriales bacterium]
MKERLSLPGWRGSPLIVDFFSSTCVVCFKSLPKLNRLQEQFKGEVRFLLIGKEDKAIRSVYEKFRQRLNLKLDVAYDSVLHRDLRSYSYPLYVWIDSSGIVRAVTGVDQLTPENVKIFARHKIPAIGQPVQVAAFNAGKPFLVNGNGGVDSLFLSRSLFSLWNKNTPLYLPPHINYGILHDSLQLLGVSISDLYLYAYFNEARWPSSSKLYGNVFPYPVLENGIPLPIVSGTGLYCYSLWLSPGQVPFSDLQQRFQSDLEYQFGYNAMIEYRLMPYNRITVRGGFAEKLRADTSNQGARVTYAGFELKGCALEKVIGILASKFQKELPFVDESGITYPVNLSIDALMIDFAAVKSALYQQGIEISSCVKPMRVIVLRPKMKNVAAR